MPSYTVSIESPERAAHDAEALQRFTESLMTDGRPLHPAASLNTETGVFSASFQVVADNLDEAAFTACLAYWGAIGAAGAELNGDSQVSVERVDDPSDAAPFTATATISRTG